MKHTHFYFGKALPCRNPEKCFLAKLEAPKPQQRPEWKRPEGTPMGLDEMKEEGKKEDERKKRQKARYRNRPKPLKPLQAARHGRTGPFGTDKATCLDSRLD